MLKKIYRVYDLIPTKYGHERANIAIYRRLKEAKRDARKRVKSLRKEITALGETRGVAIEDIHSGNYIYRWKVTKKGIEKKKGGYAGDSWSL
mgnify:CR=1 FL=1